MIQSLLDLPYTYIERFDNGVSTVCKLKAESCDAIIYGSLLLQLGRVGLWPKKEAEDYTSSLNSLAELIKGLTPASLPAIPGAHGEDHSACKAPSFKDDVLKVMSSIPDPTLDCHRTHMEERSKPRKFGRNSLKEAECRGKKSLIVKLNVPPQSG